MIRIVVKGPKIDGAPQSVTFWPATANRPQLVSKVASASPFLGRQIADLAEHLGRPDAWDKEASLEDKFHFLAIQTGFSVAKATMTTISARTTTFTFSEPQWWQRLMWSMFPDTVNAWSLQDIRCGTTTTGSRDECGWLAFANSQYRIAQMQGGARMLRVTTNNGFGWQMASQIDFLSVDLAGGDSKRLFLLTKS